MDNNFPAVKLLRTTAGCIVHSLNLQPFEIDLCAIVPRFPAYQSCINLIPGYNCSDSLNVGHC